LKRLVIYLFLLGGFFACKKENATDCFKSNGSEITIQKDLGPFSEIVVSDKIDLTVNQGSEFKVEVTAGENIIDNISVEKRKSVLEINNNNKCNFVRGYKRRVLVTVTVPFIRKVINNGVGTVRFGNDFVQDTLFVRAENSGDVHVHGKFVKLQTSSHGNGDIYLNGSCDTLYVYMFGTNFLKAENLKINHYTFVETISIGDCSINAPSGGILDCNLWRSGNIYYSGDPAVINNFSDGSAKGKLIKK
jgi:hypothetical protein